MPQNDNCIVFSQHLFLKMLHRCREKKKQWGRRGECDSSSEGDKKKKSWKWKTDSGVSLKIVVFVCFPLCQVLLWLILCSEKPTETIISPSHSLRLFLFPSFFIVSLEVGLSGEEWRAEPSPCLRTGTWLSSQMASGSERGHTGTTELWNDTVATYLTAAYSLWLSATYLTHTAVSKAAFR